MQPVEERPMLPTAIAGDPATRSFLTSLTLVLLRAWGNSGYRLNRVLPKDGTEPMIAPLELMTYLSAALPTASDFEGAIIYVSDGASGSKFQGSDGTSWVSLG